MFMVTTREVLHMMQKYCTSYMSSYQSSKLRPSLNNHYSDFVSFAEEGSQKCNEDILLSKWSRNEDRYMAIASLTALRSKDPRTPVGACIVDASKKVVGIGYNSMPYHGVTKTGKTNDDETEFFWKSRDPGRLEEEYTKHPYVCHAAMNAIAGKTIADLTNCTIYLTQHPDEDCANIIVQSGIKEVKYQRNTNGGNKTYERNAESIFQLHAVSIKECNPKTEVSIHLSRKQCNWTVDPLLMNLSWECAKVQLQLNLCKRIEEVDATPAKEKAQPDKYITWDELFMGLALLEHVYSNVGDKVPDVKVGACLVNSSNQVIAVGGSSASEDPRTLGRRQVYGGTGHSLSTRDMYAHHAEYKTIASYKGIKDIKGCTLYVTTSPCNVCAKLIVQSGIKKVFYKKRIPATRIFDLSKTIFEGCQITCEQLECVEKVTIHVRNDRPAPFPREWERSTGFQCTHFENVGKGNPWFYYSLQLSDYSLNDSDEYFIKSFNIYSTAAIKKGEMQVVTSSKTIDKDNDEIEFERDDGKCTHFTTEYQNIAVKTDTHLCRVKITLLEQSGDQYTLKDDYRMYFDIILKKQ